MSLASGRAARKIAKWKFIRQVIRMKQNYYGREKNWMKTASQNWTRRTRILQKEDCRLLVVKRYGTLNTIQKQKSLKMQSRTETEDIFVGNLN